LSAEAGEFTDAQAAVSAQQDHQSIARLCQGGESASLLHIAGRCLRLGAKLGAIRCGLLWTAVDASGIGTLPFRAVWTAVDACGRRM
jgi:hypothetical protein